MKIEAYLVIEIHAAGFRRSLDHDVLPIDSTKAIRKLPAPAEALGNLKPRICIWFLERDRIQELKRLTWSSKCFHA